MPADILVGRRFATPSIVSDASVVSDPEASVAIPIVSRSVEVGIFWQNDCDTKIAHCCIAALTLPAGPIGRLVKIAVLRNEDCLAMAAYPEVASFARPGFTIR